MNFKDRLNEALIMRNMNAAELARTSGVNEGAISQYRKGNYKANQYNLEKMAKALGVSIPWLMGANIDSPLPINKNNFTKGVKIPLLGRVVAGVPLEAIENIEGYEEITPALAAKGSYFALRVMGKSMEPFFLENDIVIVRKTKAIESGAIAIVLVNGSDATVKKVKIQDNGVTLIGFNTSVYEPHFYNSEEVKTLPLEIIGQVVESKRILVNV